jgi:hypothetical protein
LGGEARSNFRLSIYDFRLKEEFSNRQSKSSIINQHHSVRLPDWFRRAGRQSNHRQYFVGALGFTFFLLLTHDSEGEFCCQV